MPAATCGANTSASANTLGPSASDNRPTPGIPTVAIVVLARPAAIALRGSTSCPAAFCASILSPIEAGKSAAPNANALAPSPAMAASGATAPAIVGAPYLPIIPPKGSVIF